MSVKPKSISELAEYWDELTPTQQQFMIQRAQIHVARNRMEAMNRKTKHRSNLTDQKTKVDARTSKGD